MQSIYKKKVFQQSLFIILFFFATKCKTEKLTAKSLCGKKIPMNSDIKLTGTNNSVTSRFRYSKF